MKFCHYSPYHIVCVSCLYPPVKSIRFKVGELPKHIIKMVAMFYDTSVYQLKGQSKKREIVTARQIAMSLVSIFVPELSLVKIGKVFNRDHSTVIYSKQTVENLCDTDKKYKKKYTEIHDRVRIFVEKGTIESDLKQLNNKDQ